jgi:hypothetical protein
LKHAGLCGICLQNIAHAQVTLDHFVMVRIHARQPLQISAYIDCSSKYNRADGGALQTPIASSDSIWPQPIECAILPRASLDTSFVPALIAAGISPNLKTVLPIMSLFSLYSELRVQ